VDLAAHRLERPDQHSVWAPLDIGHGVEAPVDAVVEVDVGSTGCTEQALVAARASDAGSGVRRRIIRAFVGFDLHDPA
jgi:hypothetical protein